MKTIFSSILLTLVIVMSNFPVKAQENLTTIEANQEIPTIEERPYASHFFVKDFLEWEFDKDPDAIHNVSTVSLNSRIQGEKVNDYQSLDGRVASLAIVNKNTSGTPSQGSTKKEIYNFTNWQYIDVLVAWAGSAGEGIIVPPSSDITDIAHRNGVPVLGTVFFPPIAYGGKDVWLDEFLVKGENGNFPVADKMIEMANIYGFDGWFINEEIDGYPEHGKLFQEFLDYYNQNKPNHQEIMWYDAMTEGGKVSWQNQLNRNNEMFFQTGEQRRSDSMFLNFWWNNGMLKNSRDKAIKLNRDPFDVYAGIDVQGSGINTRYSPNTLRFDNSGDLMLSLGLYGPDWTLRDGANENVEKYWKNEQDFWINDNGDPRQASQPSTWGGWPGISSLVVEKSAVTSLPFVTNFDVGHGDNQYQNGKVVKTGTFNNRSIQDLLPTYKWIIDQKDNKMEASFAYEEVFNGGSSILLAGETFKNSETKVDLYATDLKLTDNNKGKIVYKGDAEVSLVLKDKGLTD